jgi:hypothetical protein
MEKTAKKSFFDWFILVASSIVFIVYSVGLFFNTFFLFLGKSFNVVDFIVPISFIILSYIGMTSKLKKGKNK